MTGKARQDPIDPHGLAKFTAGFGQIRYGASGLVGIRGAGPSLLRPATTAPVSAPRSRSRRWPWSAQTRSPVWSIQTAPSRRQIGAQGDDLTAKQTATLRPRTTAPI